MHTHDPSEDEGRPIDMRLADLDIIQDLFYSDAFIARVGAMINAEKYVDAMRTLRILCASSAADPYAIAGEWRRILAILGDDLVGPGGLVGGGRTVSVLWHAAQHATSALAGAAVGLGGGGRH